MLIKYSLLLKRKKKRKKKSARDRMNGHGPSYEVLEGKIKRVLDEQPSHDLGAIAPELLSKKSSSRRDLRSRSSSLPRRGPLYFRRQNSP